MSSSAESTATASQKTNLDVLRALAARAAAADDARKPFLRDLVMSTFQKMTPEEQLLAIESGVLEMNANACVDSAVPAPTAFVDAGAVEVVKSAGTPALLAANSLPTEASELITAKVQSRPLNAAAAPFFEPAATRGGRSAGGRQPRESRRRNGTHAQNDGVATPAASELHPAPDTPAAEVPVAPTKSIVLDPCAFRTIMCSYFARQTVCPNDKRCMYAHGSAQMRTREQNTEDGITTLAAIDAFMRHHTNTDELHTQAGAPSAADNSPFAAAASGRFRTQMCKAFETGCRRGDMCPFAHGLHQLRSRQQNMSDGLVTEAAILHFVQTGELPPRPSGATPTPTSPTATSTTRSTRASEATPGGEMMDKRAQHALLEAEQREATKEYTIATAFRTQLCPHATADRCPRGTRCQRAHGKDELRTHQQNIDDGITTFSATNYFKDHGCPPGWGASGAPPQPQLVTEIPKPSTFRTRVCSYYGPGKCCKHGDWCVYAHGEAQMRTEEENIAAGITTLEAIEAFLHKQAPSNGTPQDTRESFVASCLRTQICPNWKKGSCDLGNRCRRAHSKSQLRTREQNIEAGIVTREAVEYFLEFGCPPPPGTELPSVTTLASPTTLTSPTSISPTAFVVMAPPVPPSTVICDQQLASLQAMLEQGKISPAGRQDAQHALIIWHQLRELRSIYFDYSGKPIPLPSLEASANRTIVFNQLCQALADH